MDVQKVVDLFRKPNFRGIIGVSIILAFIAYIFLLFFKVIPYGNKDIILPAAGYLAAKASTIVDWHFGGSKDKSDSDKVEAIKDTANISVTQ
jgi:hypothetical protein